MPGIIDFQNATLVNLNLDLDDLQTSGSAYGELYINGSTGVATPGGTGVWSQVPFDNAGASSNTTLDTGTGHHIEIEIAGTYLVMTTTSINADAITAQGVDLEYQVKKNEGTEDIDNLYVSDRQYVISLYNNLNTTMSGLVSLDIGDTVELWVRNTSNDLDLIVSYANLSILKIA